MTDIYIVPGTTALVTNSTVYSGSISLDWEVRRDGVLISQGVTGESQDAWLVEGTIVGLNCQVQITVPNQAIAVDGYVAHVKVSSVIYGVPFSLVVKADALNLTATQNGHGTIALSWTNIPNFIEYHVYKYPTFQDAIARTSGVSITTITSAGAHNFDYVACADSLHLLHFRVAVVQVASGPEGLFSNVCSIAPYNDIPPAASAQSLTLLDTPTRQWRINWTDAAKPTDFSSYWFNRRKLNLDGITYTILREEAFSANNHTFNTLFGDWEYAISIEDSCSVFTPDNVLFPSSLSTSYARSTPPSVPSTPVAVASDQTVTLNWTDVVDSDYGLAFYRIYINGSTVAGATSPTSDATITGLTNGTSYTFKVSSVDIWGNESAKSSASTSVTPADTTAPQVPSLLADPGDGQIVLTWGMAFSDLSGFKLYDVTGSVGSYVYTLNTTLSSSLRTLTISSLTNGVAKAYAITAFDEVPNETAYSNVVIATPSASTPHPTSPSIASAVGHDKYVTLTITKTTGVSGHTALINISGTYVPVVGTYTDFGSTLRVVVPNLTNNIDYSFVAVSQGSTGFISATSTPVVGRPVDDVFPSTPLTLTATPADQSVILNWSAVVDTSLSNYKINRYIKNSDLSYTPYTTGGWPVTVSSSTLTYTATGLSNGIPSYFSVASRDGAGNISNFHSIVEATPYDSIAPSTPNAPNLISGNGYVQLIVHPLASPPYDIHSYRVFRNTTNLVFEVLASDLGTANLFDTAVLNGETYTYSVAAVDTSGNQSPLSIAAYAMPIAPTLSIDSADNAYETNCERVRLRLRGEFINDGAPYFTGRINVINQNDSNFVDIRFGFDIVDVDTRDALTVLNVESLILSNSPVFDSTAVVELTAIPFNASGVSVVTLDKRYFTDPEHFTSVELSRFIVTDGTSGPNTTFLIKNWPLAGSGGTSTVYYKARISNTDNEQIALFPMGYQPYMSILWDSEPPVAPGVPVAKDRLTNKTGEQTLWSFSGVSGTPHILSYSGTLVSFENNNTKLLSTFSPNTNRSILPGVSTFSLTTTGYVYHESTDAYTPSGGIVLGSGIEISSTEGMAFSTNLGLTIGSAITDRGGAIELRYTPTYIVTGGSLKLRLRAVANYGGMSFDPHNGDALEVLISVDNQITTASLRHVNAGRIKLGKSQTTTLPLWATSSILAGGSIELLFAPNGTNMPIYVEAYFTPKDTHSNSIDTRESLLLGSCYLPGFEAASPWDVRGVFTATTDDSSNWAVKVDEFSLYGGRTYLGMDLGTCQKEISTPVGYPSVETLPVLLGGSGWTADINTNSIWSVVSDYTLSGIESSLPAYEADDASIYMSSPVLAAGRSFISLIANRPTFSSRTMIRWNMKHVRGEFFVTLSPVAFTDQNADLIARRCDPYSGAATLPYDEPTILIGFSSSESAIYVAERLTNGTLSTKTLISPWNPPSDTEYTDYSIELNSSDSRHINTMSLILRQNGNNIGDAFTVRELPSQQRGEGWYCAIGVRSDKAGYFEDNTNARATVERVQIYGLPEPYDNDSGLPLDCYFLKANAGLTQYPALLGQGLLAAQSELRGWPYIAPDNKKSLFCSWVSIEKVGDVVGFNTAKLLEIKLRRRQLHPAPGCPRIKFYQTLTNGQLVGELTDWISARLSTSGGVASYEEIVQFDLTEAIIPIGDNGGFWFVIETPAYCELAGIVREDSCQDSISLLATPPISGDETNFYRMSSRADGLWYKIYQSFLTRRNNSRSNTLMQLRVRANSVTGYVSASSRFSTPLTVDVTKPQNTAFTGAPELSLAFKPTVRTVTVDIAADDNDAVTDFCVFYEAESGRVVSTPWLSWTQFAAEGIDNTARYTIFLYDDKKDALVLNGSFDGPRKVWARVMDSVGNIAETAPLMVFAQSVALVDTKAPKGNVSWVDPFTGDITETTNKTTGYVRLGGEDAVSGIKDIRIRDIGSQVWGDWQLYSTYRSIVLSGSNSKDGLSRIEAQFRDWGGNAEQASPLWNALAYGVAHGILFNVATLWKSPTDTEVSLYLGAIKSNLYTDYDLVVDGSNYKAKSTVSGSIGRTIPIRITDHTIVRVNGSIWTYWNQIDTAPGSNYYHIDAASGNIVFDYTLPTTPDLSIDIRRETAQLYRWDGHSLLRVADLGSSGELAILALCGSDGGLLLGGGSGKLWYSDGINVFGPIFTATTSGISLPISVLHSHKFTHESQPYIYLGTGSKPRLFRAPLSLATQGDQWSEVAPPDDYFSSLSSGSLLSLGSAFNTLFIGTDFGVIYTLKKTPVYSNVSNLEDTWGLNRLSAPYFDTDPIDSRPITTLLSTTGQMIAGIGDRPEIWSYAEIREKDTSHWATVQLGNKFLAHPAPWQFYTSTPTLTRQYDTRIGQYTGVTNALQSGKCEVITFTDYRAIGGFSEAITITGENKKMAAFLLGSASDWGTSLAGQHQWMLELTMQRLSGSGRQGFSASDGRYFVEVSVDGSRIKVTSRGSVAEYIYRTEEFTALSSVSDTGVGFSSQRVYPDGSTLVMWNFPSVSNTTKIGQLVDGYTSAVTDGDIQGWQAAGGIISPDKTQDAGTVLSKEYLAGQRTNRNTYITYLNIVSAKQGPVRIVQGADEIVQVFSSGEVTILNAPSSFLPVRVDTRTKLYVRCRVRPPVNGDLRDAKIRATWSNSNSINIDENQWVEAPLFQEWREPHPTLTTFQDATAFTYVLEPSWSGEVRTLAIEWVGLPEDNLRSNIEVEFISIASDYLYPDPNQRLTQIRLGVDDTRIKLWLGDDPVPVIDEPDFLTLPVDQDDYSIHFGKLSTDNSEPASTWAYSNLKFTSGAPYAPSRIVTKNWERSARFSSAGGIRKLLHYAGTAYAITDGVDFMRREDDPENRAAQLFSYNPIEKQWSKRSPSFPIDTDGNACVRALDAIVYKNEIVLAGHVNPVRYGV